MIKILIADDHAIVRSGLRQLFNLEGDISVVGEAADGIELMELLQKCEPDLLLLDLTMPKISGVALIKLVRVHHANLPILVLSMHAELEIAKPIFQAGVQGYIYKGSSHNSLMFAVRKVVKGGRFMDPVISDQMLLDKNQKNKTTVPHERLTERELHILKQFSKGQTIILIAEGLCISHKTVSTYKSRLMHKMDIRSNAALVRYATEHGLI